MPWNFDTERFDPPMVFSEILLLPKQTDQVFHVEDFVFYKSIKMKLPLSRPEKMFMDAAGIYSEILSDGWSSPFDQIYTWNQFSDIIEVLTFCGHPIAAGLVTEARQIYYQGRTDLDTIETRIKAGLDGNHLTPEEESRFYDIGEAFEKQAETAYYPDLMKWVVAHRDEFAEFRETGVRPTQHDTRQAMKLETESQRVLVGNQWWRFAERVTEAIQLGDRVFVIFDYMGFPQGRPAPNLRAYDLHQKLLWTAAHPVDQSAAAYVHFLSETSLVAWNFACFRCTLDEASGEIIEAQFTK